MGSYDPKGREIVADFARVMRALGTQFGVLKKEKCTGDPARRLGNDLLFGDLAEQGLKAFATARVKKIVTICPHCVRTMATDWLEYGVAPEIEHHSEFMARHAHLLPQQKRREHCVSRPLLPRAVSRRVRRAARGGRDGGRVGGGGAASRAVVLLRCWRWAGVSGRGERASA